MVDRVSVIRLDNSALAEIVKGGGRDARFAFNELGGRATGGNDDAQALVLLIEKKISSGEIKLPQEESVQKVGRLKLLDRIGGLFSGRDHSSQHFLPPDGDPEF